MTDDQFRQLRTLILDQGVKIEALSLEVRKLKQALETTDVVYVTPDDYVERVDIPTDIKKFLPPGKRD